MIKAKKRKHVPQAPQEYTPSYEELQDKLKSTNWPKTTLFTFLTSANNNNLISLVKLKGYMRVLSDLVDAFEKANRKLAYSNDDELVIASLFARAYGSFLASIRLSSSGQLTDSWAQSRASLECGLYAFYMHDDPRLIHLWTSRQKTEQHRKDCRKHFQHKKIVDKLKVNHSSLANRADQLYQKCIDYGAHPTEWSVAINWQILQEGGRQLTRLNLLNSDKAFMPGCLVFNADVGLCVLSIFNLAYPDEFKAANMPIVISNIARTFRAIALTTSQILRSEGTKDQEKE